jgi:hypothetical protein
MQKIPVGETIAYAYRFLFGNLGALFGILWFPIALFTVTGLIFSYYNLSVLEASPDASPFDSVPLLLMVIIFVLSLLLWAMLTHAVTEGALGLSNKTSLIYFSAGRPVMRMMGAILLCYLIIGSVYLALALGFMLFAVVLGALIGIVSGGAQAEPGSMLGISLFAVAVGVGALSALVYVALRLTFFMAPIVVAEKTLSPRRMWDLGKGQFWRMFVISIAIMLPATILYCIIFSFLMDVSDFTAFAQLPDETPEAHLARLHARDIEIARRPLEFWYVVQPLGIVALFLIYGLGPAASAFAYRARTSYEGHQQQQAAQDA